jgi:hypothetical protein
MNGSNRWEANSRPNGQARSNSIFRRTPESKLTLFPVRVFVTALPDMAVPLERLPASMAGHGRDLRNGPLVKIGREKKCRLALSKKFTPTAAAGRPLSREGQRSGKYGNCDDFRQGSLVVCNIDSTRFFYQRAAS